MTRPPIALGRSLAALTWLMLTLTAGTAVAAGASNDAAATAGSRPATVDASGSPVDAKAPRRVQTSLLVERDVVAPGTESWMALRLVVIPEWHVYWKNPGDSGLPPSVRWEVPAGVEVGPIVWPHPTRIPFGPFANYGYEGDVTLPLRLAIDAARDPSAPLTLVARAEWLVCHEGGCIPEKATLTRTLDSASHPGPPGADAPRIAAALARAPRPAEGWTARVVAETADTVELAVRAPDGVDLEGARLAFFPETPGQIAPGVAPEVNASGSDATIRLAKAPELTGALGDLPAVLVATPLDGGGDAAPLAIALRASAAASPAHSTIATALALAFAGGLLLNLMPCVFPLLAIKILSFASHAGERRARTLAHGAHFGAGVIVSFWILAAVLLALRAAGAEVGWGFQLQSPAVVWLLAALFFVLGLAFVGAFDVGSSLPTLAARVPLGGGYTGSFMSGALATLIATPCTAPFMGAALGFAVVAPVGVALLVFTALGVGMALPYVALTALPGLVARLPRPGPWMETLKQTLAFPLFATVVWLLWVFGLQTGTDALALALLGLVLVGLGVWTLGRFGGTHATGSRRAGARVAAALACSAGLAIAWPRPPAGGVERTTEVAQAARPAAVAPRVTDHGAGSLDWIPYSTAHLAALRAAGRPVLLDFTAAWCLTCQVNERLVLSLPAVRARLAELGVALLRADWTSRDPEITRALDAFGRSGVPLNVLYGRGPDHEPTILPALLTPGALLAALDDVVGPPDATALHHD